jgi:hypothetical protein
MTMNFRKRVKALVGLMVVAAIGSGFTASGVWDEAKNDRGQAGTDSASQVEEQKRLTQQQMPLPTRASWEMLFRGVR